MATSLIFTHCFKRKRRSTLRKTKLCPKLGIIASGGSMNVESNLHHNFKINKVGEIYKCSWEQLKQEVLFLKDFSCNYEVEDDSIQPSKNNKITTCLLVEMNIKVDNCYEILVPIKKDVIDICLIILTTLWNALLCYAIKHLKI